MTNPTIITINGVALVEVLNTVLIPLLVILVLFFLLNLLMEEINKTIKNEKRIKKLKQEGFKNQDEMKARYKRLIKEEKYEGANNIHIKFKDYWYD